MARPCLPLNVGCWFFLSLFFGFFFFFVVGVVAFPPHPPMPHVLARLDAGAGPLNPTSEPHRTPGGSVLPFLFFAIFGAWRGGRCPPPPLFCFWFFVLFPTPPPPAPLFRRVRMSAGRHHASWARPRFRGGGTFAPNRRPWIADGPRVIAFCSACTMGGHCLLCFLFFFFPNSRLEPPASGCLTDSFRAIQPAKIVARLPKAYIGFTGMVQRLVVGRHGYRRTALLGWFDAHGPGSEMRGEPTWWLFFFFLLRSSPGADGA